MLKSAVSTDYTQLQQLLAMKMWGDADEETARVMLEVASKVNKDYLIGKSCGEHDPYLNEEDFKYFPHEDLYTIDQLWLKYSNGRFGFSVQKRIYENLGGTSDWERKIWRTFSETVGWKEKGSEYSEGWKGYRSIFYPNVRENRPEGNLPVVFEPLYPTWVLGGDFTAKTGRSASTRVALFYRLDFLKEQGNKYEEDRLEQLKREKEVKIKEEQENKILEKELVNQRKITFIKTSLSVSFFVFIITLILFKNLFLSLLLLIVLSIIFLRKQNFTTAKATIKNIPEVDENELNDDLSSSLNIDYRELRRLLSVGDFKNANLETKRLFGRFISGKYEISWGDLVDNSYKISKIPSKDLITINNLWFNYSNGLYGFNVQCAIFHKIYNQYEAQIVNKYASEKTDITDEKIKGKIMKQTLISFKEEVGWENSDSGIPVLNIKGNLPNVFGSLNSIGGLQSIISLFNRIKEIALDDD